MSYVGWSSIFHNNNDVTGYINIYSKVITENINSNNDIQNVIQNGHFIKSNMNFSKYDFSFETILFLRKFINGFLKKSTIDALITI